MSKSMRTVTAADVQNNCGKYLQYAIDNGEIVILRNGKRVARIVSDQSAVGCLTDSLRGVLKQDYSEEQIRSEKIQKHESVD